MDVVKLDEGFFKDKNYIVRSDSLALCYDSFWA